MIHGKYLTIRGGSLRTCLTLSSSVLVDRVHPRYSPLACLVRWEREQASGWPEASRTVRPWWLLVCSCRCCQARTPVVKVGPGVDQSDVAPYVEGLAFICIVSRR